nr:proline-rich receptor-like protein kinase PERK2 [Lolium perenne]
MGINVYPYPAQAGAPPAAPSLPRCDYLLHAPAAAVLAYLLHARAAGVPSLLSLRAPPAKTPFPPPPCSPTSSTPPPSPCPASSPSARRRRRRPSCPLPFARAPRLGAPPPRALSTSLLEGPVLLWAGRLSSPRNPFLSHANLVCWR